MNLHEQTTETFDQNARSALVDPQLRSALRKLTVTFGERRAQAIASVDDWEGLREQARAIKDETLSHLDKYLADFADKAQRAGAQIHWADDGKDVCQLIIRLLQERNAKQVVKSKSMATEEIHLNTALEGAGITPVETDLGEWIIQLAHETPSHIVVPAIHKSKKQIADLFVEKLGIEPVNTASTRLVQLYQTGLVAREPYREPVRGGGRQFRYLPLVDGPFVEHGAWRSERTTVP